MWLANKGMQFATDECGEGACDNVVPVHLDQRDDTHRQLLIESGYLSMIADGVETIVGPIPQAAWLASSEDISKRTSIRALM